MFALGSYLGSYLDFVLNQEWCYLHIDTQLVFPQLWEKIKKD